MLGILVPVIIALVLAALNSMTPPKDPGFTPGNLEKSKFKPGMLPMPANIFGGSFGPIWGILGL